MPHPGKKHFHLLGRRVLGLVEDDKGIFQGAAPHVGQGHHLDERPAPRGAGTAPPLRCLGARRTGGAGTGRPFPASPRAESPASPRPPPRAGSDEPPHLAGLEGGHPHGHRPETSYPSPRARCRNEAVAADGLHVQALSQVRGRWHVPSGSPGVNRCNPGCLPSARRHLPGPGAGAYWTSCRLMKGLRSKGPAGLPAPAPPGRRPAPRRRQPVPSREE